LGRIRTWMSRYVDAGKLPGALTLVARGGEIAYLDQVGVRDVASGAPWTQDTILRFYSMTKPITSVALMMLYEEGGFGLDDPLDAYIPAFRDVQMLAPGATRLDQVLPAPAPPTLHHLLTHTSGFIYGFNGGVLGAAYEARKLHFAPASGGLESMCAQLAEMPLSFAPGERWSYGVSTDVIGRLVEILSGQPFDRFLRERILDPLGMQDTAFDVPAAKASRFASLYTPDGDGGMSLVESGTDSAYLAGKVDTFSGGGGLLSTVGDYWRFTEMLRGGGALGDVRLLGPRTVSFMTRNHLPGDLASMGQPVFNEVSFDGIGFGLGFWVMLDPARARTMGNAGDHGWGGMASTTFWRDPVDDLTVLFLTQLRPSSSYPLRQQLRALVHQAQL
jgi:CubicO group peptidase (beta-lactamase class C family)